jgi:hypothetical protein
VLRCQAEDRQPAAHGVLDDLGGAAGAASLAVVPDRDEQVGVLDEQLANRQVAEIPHTWIIPATIELDDPIAGLNEQPLENRARRRGLGRGRIVEMQRGRFGALEVAGVDFRSERQEGLQLDAAAKRHAGHELVRALGERRNETNTRRARCEEPA